MGMSSQTRALTSFSFLPWLPLTWRDRREERRSCESGREQALPDEESAGVTGGESAGVSTLLLRSRLQSPPPVMPALDPLITLPLASRKFCVPPLVTPALTLSGPAYRRPLRQCLRSSSGNAGARPSGDAALDHSRGSSAFPSSLGSDCHASGRLLRSLLRHRVVVRRSVPNTCRRLLQ